MMLKSIAALIALALLAGCFNMGPLVLPQAPAADAATPAPPPGDAPPPEAQPEAPPPQAAAGNG